MALDTVSTKAEMKLTTKLILAFLLVSLFSTGIIAAFTRISTNREFDKFVSDRYKAELVAQIGAYYQANQTWAGVGTLFNRDHFNPDGNRPLFFSIADKNGVIVVAGNDHAVGEIVSTTVFNAGTQIQAGNETVGVLLLNTPPNRNPLEDAFIRRINDSVFLSAIVTFLIALILGAVLSRTITRPIRELTSATHKMANGNFGQQVPVRSRDEIGELASSFNKMNDDLARSFNLRKQMTADIAHELRTPLSLITVTPKPSTTACCRHLLKISRSSVRRPNASNNLSTICGFYRLPMRANFRWISNPWM
jgi:two-component system sensor histidine kinase BaeS